MSPALAGGFLTTVPPGKSPDPEFKISTINSLRQGSVSIIKQKQGVIKEPKGGNYNHGKKSGGRWDLHTDGFGRIACSGEGMAWGRGMSQL